MGAIYQSPCGHMLIDSLPNTSQQSTPTQWWCVLHFSAISNNNFFFNLQLYNTYKFFLDILGILKPIIHPRLQQWRVLSYQLISFLLERRKLFLGIAKMIIIIN